MQRKLKIWMGTVVVLLLCLLAACSSLNFTRDGYRALTISFNAYDVALSGMGDLYREKLITDPVRDAAIKYGKAYKTAHNGAVKALATYEEQGGEANKQAVLAGMSQASRALAELIAYCKPYLAKYGKEVPQ